MQTYDGPRHRGSTRSVEAPRQCRKYFKQGLRISQQAYYEAWRANEIVQEQSQAWDEAHEQQAFFLSLDRVKLSNHPTYEMIREVYRLCHPRANLTATLQ